MTDQQPCRYLKHRVLIELGMLSANGDSRQISSINFSDSRFQLRTLNMIEYYGKKPSDRFRRDGVTHIDVSNNDLTSLVQLCVAAGTGDEDMFVKARFINARRNHLTFLCPTAVNQYQNSWPTTMASLQVLDLSHNQLTKIPRLSSMPNLEQLDLSHNYISEGNADDNTFRASLMGGKKLRNLDLSFNVLNWQDDASFCRDLKVFNNLRSLESLDFAHNNFCNKIPDWVDHCIRNCTDRLRRCGGETINYAKRNRAKDNAPKIQSSNANILKTTTHDLSVDPSVAIKNTFYARQPLLRADVLRTLDKCLHSPMAAAAAIAQLEESLEYLFHHPSGAKAFFGADDAEEAAAHGSTDTTNVPDFGEALVSSCLQRCLLWEVWVVMITCWHRHFTRYRLFLCFPVDRTGTFCCR